MTLLYVLFGLVAVFALFVLLLSARITINAEFFEEFKLNVSWLFIKIPILPAKKSDKPKKEKKPRKEKQEEEPESEEQPEEKKEEKEKKENIFVKFYNNQGFEGVIELINNIAFDIAKMVDSFRKHIVIRELYLFMTVTGGCDAAETAMKYGETCQKVFPAMSFICTTLPVKKYDVEIEPDFLGLKDSAQFAASVHIRPIFFINALIVFVIRLIFNVVLKFLLGILKKSKKENKNKGGAL